MFDLGDPVPLGITVKDSLGSLADATAVTLTLTLPDGSTATPSVTHDGTGIYSVAYATTQAGRHVVHWVATGTNACVFNDSFEVSFPTLGSLVSLAELRAHLNWPTTRNTADDDLLLLFGATATDLCEAEMGRPLRTASVTEMHNGGRPSIRLRRLPCPCVTCTPLRTLTVTTVIENSNTLTTNDYSVDYPNGVIWRGRTFSMPWIQIGPAPGISVTYTAGYLGTPAWASMAVKRLVEHLWSQSQQSRHGRDRGASPEANASSLAYLLPYAVQSLLEPHALPDGMVLR